MDDQRDNEGTADVVRLPALVEALEPRIATQILDEEKASSAERPERELEEPLGEIRVRALEAARGGRREPSPFAEVDRDVTARCQLGDPVDSGLERVRERKLGDRLADDADDRLRAPEGGRDQADAPAPAKRQSSTGRKRKKE